MATNEAGPPARTKSRLIRAVAVRPSPPDSGFFTIYKSGQGYWTRMGTVAAGAVPGDLLTLTFLYQQNCQVLLRPVVCAPPQWTRPTRTADGEQMPSAAERSREFDRERIPPSAICAVFLHGLCAHDLLAHQQADQRRFLIATDSEMKKVNWTSRKELIGSTKVVIGFMFMIAFLLFATRRRFRVFFQTDHGPQGTALLDKGVASVAGCVAGRPECIFPSRSPQLVTRNCSPMQFFVLRVASNKEDRVREALARKVKIEGC